MVSQVFDIVVVGGGPVGLAAAYEVAKSDKSVLVLEQNNFFNQAGSSGDLARMFRTMYTEDFMADLAKKAMDLWDNLEKDAGLSLRWMSGLLNFGDENIGHDTPEGTLLGPIDNLKRLEMTYKELTAKEIEAKYPFKNLNPEWIGLYAPDNGVINVQQLLRSLLSLAKDYGAKAKQHTKVERIVPSKDDSSIWEVHTLSHDKTPAVFLTRKLIITTGAYTNHVLKPSFGMSLDLDIWEMVATYFNTNAGPNGTIFPSMWFQFAPNKEDGRSQLFYGMPALPWGPPNVVRIAVDAASRRIKDPNERESSVFNPDDIRDTQDFVRDHVIGVDSTVPASTISCLQTNVFDNMFVLDFVPKEYLGKGPEKSVVVFTAGWAMKFVPLLGKALADLAVHGKSEYALEEFLITRKDEKTGKGIIEPILERNVDACAVNSSFSFTSQAQGSSCRGKHNTGL
ncbi:Fc.00g072660.m01.CDS01 [Cosmosporella sp. VM-42]